MKKLAGLIIISSVLAFATSVFATAGANYSAVYNSSNNKVTIASLADNYSTVYITNESSGDIVYVDQNDDTFGSAVDFLLKASPANGYYKVQLGTDDNSISPNPGIMYFYVGSISTSEVQMTYIDRIQYGGDSRIGWYVTNQSLDGLYSLKITFNNGATVAGFSLKDAFGLEGSGTLNAGFQLEGLPAADADPARTKVYLSPDKVSNFKNN